MATVVYTLEQCVMGMIVFRLGGAICALVAVIFGIVVPIGVGREVAHIEALSPVDIKQIEGMQVGSAVLIEGRISPKTSPQFDAFVAYQREKPKPRRRDSSSSGGSNWETDKRVTPPLILDLSDGEARVVNTGYDLGATSDWEHIDLPEGQRRISGLRAGDAVMVVATLQSASDGVRLEASLVSGGTKASYLASQRILWRVFTTIGALVGVISIVLLWVGWRRRAS